MVKLVRSYTLPLFILTFLIPGTGNCQSHKNDSNCIERIYRVNDSNTGGYVESTLKLKCDYTLILDLTTTVHIGENDAGEILESKLDSIHGNWSIHNNIISCRFNTTQSKFDSIFQAPAYWKAQQVISGNNTISLSLKTDTLSIFSVPSVLQPSNPTKNK